MINEADISVDVIAMSAHPASLEFYLETPNGQIVQPGDTITLPGATYGLGTHVAFYRLNVPLLLGAPEHAGKWHAILAFNGKYNRKHAEVTHGYNTAASAASLPYSVLVHTYSNLKMQTRLSQLMSDHVQYAALIARYIVCQTAFRVKFAHLHAPIIVTLV